ncbi:bifunctional precorrin-2 dehydrogenase/sirohydrochlorin ferrochelatase [Aquifex pyrophilus]
MAYFPLFVNLKGKKVLVVGGGKVGTRKVKSLLPFGANVKVVSPKFTEELLHLGNMGKVELVKRRFKPSDLKGVDIVIVAVDNIKLQERIYRLCEKRKILCNSVDSPEFCNFIFPSVIKRGNLVIGISTSGKVPALSRALREKLESCIPEDIENILEELSRLRSSMKKGRERQKRLLREARKRLRTS